VAMTEIDLMTICSGFVGGGVGETAAGGAADVGQASRRPVMLHSIFDAEWQRSRECIACSCFLHVFWHFCGSSNQSNCKNDGYFESPINKYKDGGYNRGVQRGVPILGACRWA